MLRSLVDRSGISTGRLGYLVIIGLFVLCISDGLGLFTWLTIKNDKFPESVGGLSTLAGIIGTFATLIFSAVKAGDILGKKGGQSADGATDNQRSTSDSSQVKS